MVDTTNNTHNAVISRRTALGLAAAASATATAPAGFSDHGLPIGIQIIGPPRREFDCLQLAYAYETAMNPTNRRLPDLLTQT